MMGVYRCRSVISYNEYGGEIRNHQELIDNRGYHSHDEMIQDIAKKTKCES